MSLPVVEEMILLSKVIKSSYATSLESKTLSIKNVTIERSNEELAGEKPVELLPTREDEIQLALEEAEKIRQQAREEYEQLQHQLNEDVLSAQKNAEELFKQAEESGYNDGFQKGLQEGQKQYEAFISEARNIIDASKHDYYLRLEEAEPVIVQLAVKVAEKIISHSLATNNDQWLSIVKGVLNEVREQEQVKLYVHPNWFELTLSHKDELQLLLPNCENVYIYPDAHLEENGCFIETPFGRIDATVDSQLSEVKYALLEKLKELGGNESS